MKMAEFLGSGALSRCVIPLDLGNDGWFSLQVSGDGCLDIVPDDLVGNLNFDNNVLLCLFGDMSLLYGSNLISSAMNNNIRIVSQC